MISRQISMFHSQKFGQTAARQGKSTKYYQNWGSETFPRVNTEPCPVNLRFSAYTCDLNWSSILQQHHMLKCNLCNI